MKETTGNSLVVAKSLIEQAASLCGSDDIRWAGDPSGRPGDGLLRFANRARC